LWYWEVSSPLKLYEYLALGRPVLATDIAAHRAALSDSNSVLIPCSSREEIAKGFERMVRLFPQLERTLRQLPKAERADLGWHKQAQAMSDFIDKTTAR
jgi:glycosyltransferase involved in cell wall biosynthesis